MFPLRDENPTLGTSAVTFLIIGLNALAWLFVQGLGSDVSLAASICQYGLIPGELLALKADILCEGHFGICQPRDHVEAYIRKTLSQYQSE
jgi:hypothetical protein